MEMGPKGKTASVAASSEGLGRAAAALERAAREHREETAGDVLPLPGDLAAPDVPRRLIHRAVSAFGRRDILVTTR